MLTPSQVGCVLPAFSELFGNPLWRVRAAVAEALPALVSCTLCDRLRDEVVNLGRRMLHDRVDSVRRSAAEQLIMAARIDLDRCPSRPYHHVPGACRKQASLPAISRLPLPPPPPPPLSMLLLPPNGSSVVPVPTDSEKYSESDSVSPDVVADSAPESVAESEANSVNPSVKESVANSVADSMADEVAGPVVDSAVGAEENTGLAFSKPDNSDRENNNSGGEKTPEASSSSSSSEQPRRDVSASLVGGKGRSAAMAAAAAAAEATGIPLDRAGGCGLWLRLVIMPLMQECLDGSYRTKLLALHMTQAAFRLGVTTPSVMKSVVVPVLLRGLSEPLPNVRLSAARVADDILSLAVMSFWPPPGGRMGAEGRARRAEIAAEAAEAAAEAAAEQGGSGGGGGGDGVGVNGGGGDALVNGSVGGDVDATNGNVCGNANASSTANTKPNANPAASDASIGANGCLVEKGNEMTRNSGDGGSASSAVSGSGASSGDGGDGGSGGGGSGGGDSGVSDGRGGDGSLGEESWGCGWEEVEKRLEEVGAEDPDQDAAYFATQALQPKWFGDVRRP